MNQKIFRQSSSGIPEPQILFYTEGKRIIRLGLHAFFFVYVGFSVWLFEERMYGDVASWVFSLTNSEKLVIPHGRLLIVLYEALPLLAIKAGASLNTIVILFSTARPIIFYIIFLILIYNLDDLPSAMGLVVLITIAPANLFYYPVQSTIVIAFCILLFSILRSLPQKKPRTGAIMSLLAVSLAILCIYSYPAGFMFIIYIAMFDVVDTWRIKPVHIVLIMISIIYFVSLRFTATDYERNILALDNFTPTWHYVGVLFEFVIKRYSAGLILLLIATLFYLRSKKYLKALFVFSAYFGYLLIINLIYNLEKNSVIYSEHIYETSLIFLLIPVFGDFVRQLQPNTKYAIYLASLIIVIAGMVSIVNNRPQYIARLDLMKRIMQSPDTEGKTKLVLDVRNIGREIDIFKWANPYASSVLSAIWTDTPQKTIVYSSGYPNRIVSERNLNERFYSLGNNSYTFLNNPGDANQMDGPFFDSVNVLPVDIGNRYDANTEFTQLVQISNKNDTPILSGFSEDYRLILSYRWFQGEEKVKGEDLRTPLEMDIYTSHIQPMKIRTPSEPGKYQLAIGLLGKKKWAILNEKIPIVIE